MRSIMQGYWKAFTSTEFKTAAAFMHPDDLEAVQKEMPPVFIAAAQSEAKDAREMAAAFFGQHPKEKWSSLTPVEVFECLNRFLLVAAPQIFETLKGSTVVVNRFEVNGEEATIHYKVNVQGETVEDTERYSKKDGKWWLRAKENPKDTAQKFRQLLDL